MVDLQSFIMSDLLKSLQITLTEDIDYFRDLNKFADIYYPNKDLSDVYSLIRQNPGIEYRYFCFRYLKDIRNFKLSKLKQNLEKEAVIVEFRKFPHIEFIIRNAIKKLGNNWSFSVICGNKNYDFLQKMISEMSANIKLIKYNRDNIDKNSYSEVLASKEFWSKLVGEKILIYQEDTCIFRYNIDEFMEWDYIGAPWPITKNTNSKLVGNGGLSLRSKSVMLKVIDKIDILKTQYNTSTFEFMKKWELKIPPEDVYFSKNIIDFNLGKVADWTIANKFCIESIPHPNPFGGHKFWIANKNWKRFLYKKIFRGKKLRQLINDSRAKFYIKSYSIKSPFIIRKNTTDLAIFKQIFINKEYEFPINIKPKLIIDGGANVGYASLFFANKFPNAEITAIEPEESNFGILQKNTAKYKNIKPIQAGLWHKNINLKITGTEWGKCGFMTEEAGPDDNSDIKAITIDEILKQSKHDEIDILKLDIEGAEKEIFSGNCDSWLGKVNVLIIELHDRMKEGCSEAFYSAIKKYNFKETRSGENVVLFKTGQPVNFTQRPIIHLYASCYNGEVILPYFLRHYSQFVDKITIFDNYSTDSSELIAKQYDNVQFEKFDTNNKFNEDVLMSIRNHCWKNSKGNADFVIVCDMDEFLYHPDIHSFVQTLKKLQFTLAKPFGFDMIHESIPKTHDQIYDEIKYGIRWSPYDKIIIFDPNKIKAINYGPGSHSCSPEGQIKIYKNDENLKLLHYKNLGLEYLLEKNKLSLKRLSFINKANKWGYQYTFPRKKQCQDFENMLLNKELVV